MAPRINQLSPHTGESHCHGSTLHLLGVLHLAISNKWILQHLPVYPCRRAPALRWRVTGVNCQFCFRRRLTLLIPHWGNSYITQHTHTGLKCMHTHKYRQAYRHARRDVIGWCDRLPRSGAREQLGVRCLAEGQIGSAQEVNWHLSSHQFTLHTVVRAGLEPATLWFRSQVSMDWATAAPFAAVFLRRKAWYGAWLVTWIYTTVYGGMRLTCAQKS